MSLMVVYERSRWSVSMGQVLPGQAPSRSGAKVTGFSRSSGQRMRKYLSQAAAEYKYMGTLTVDREYEESAAQFKTAVDRFLVRFMLMQKNVSKKPEKEAVFWFVEFQKRGAPHLHFFYTTRVPWQKAAKAWADICKRYGMARRDNDSFYKTSTRFEELRSGQRGAASYAMKYAAKTEQKKAPEWWVGRWWGVRGNRETSAAYSKIRLKRMSPMQAEKWEKSQKRAVGACYDLVALGFARVLPWDHGNGVTFVLKRGMWQTKRDGPEKDLMMQAIRVLSMHEMTLSLLGGEIYGED